MSPATVEAPEVPVADPAEQPMPTVLMVDDEPSVLSALRRLFRPQGYKLLQATSGVEGLALLKGHAVDVVISDMRMPEMDGSRFLEAVREHDESIARILLTGYADIDATIAAINRGAIHRYISKPWDDQELLLVVQDALSRRDLVRRNAELTALTQRQNEQLTSANVQLEARVADRTAELQQINDMLEASFAELDETFLVSVNVFSSLLEMRDGQSGHSRRVADLARETAKELGLSEREVRNVYLGALVHDVGKIGFPDQMLDKPISAYTAEETARYRRHPADGETALLPLPQLQGAARIVRQHHERFDGKGFPDGLSGNEICIGARIVGPASDLDGLLRGNIGSTPLSVDRTREMMLRGVDTRYERKIVDTLLDVWAKAEASAQADLQIDVRDLLPGMVLAKDLISSKGAILLAKGYVFDERIVNHVREFAQREGASLSLRVRRDAAPNDQAAQTSAPQKEQP